MYKIASETAQAARDRLKIADLARAGLPEIQTAQDKHRNLKRRAQQLDEQIKHIRDTRPANGKRLLKELGAIKKDVMDEICSIKPRAQKLRNVAEHFVFVARERLSPPVFEIWFREAEKSAAKEIADRKVAPRKTEAAA